LLHVFTCLFDAFSHSREGGDGAHAPGPGVEREVLTVLWNRQISKGGKYLLPRQDGFSTLQCISSITAAVVSPNRRRDLKRLGAIVALLFINLIAAFPFSPATILFIVYNTIQCLTPEFIGEWFPRLRMLILDWKALGPNGDPQQFADHFASYHGLQVCHI
jgi:hypothetical protein